VASGGAFRLAPHSLASVMAVDLPGAAALRFLKGADFDSAPLPLTSLNPPISNFEFQLSHGFLRVSAFTGSVHEPGPWRAPHHLGARGAGTLRLILGKRTHPALS
jgi:hypothetical protein